jgi:hypothetical protein
MEICVNLKSIKPFGYSHYLTKDTSRLKFPIEWSEVAIFLELDNYVGDSRIVGLQHYRRFFSFDNELTEALIVKPSILRNDYAESQIQYLLEIDVETVIPKKWEFSESAYDQFLVFHPSLEELLLFSLKEFDKVLMPIFGPISSLQLLQQSNYLYPCNMFIGSREFSLEWRSILSSLVSNIESYAEVYEGTLEDRWGGFIAERLFSVYITICQETMRWSFIERPMVLFDGSDELTQQRDELTQQRDELTQQRDELLNSTIWKATKPIRWIVNLIKS